jgi:hypothetical protein
MNESVAKHHNILKYVFNGNKHLKHVLSDEDIKQMTLIENRFPLTKLPVCGHCEKLGLWSRGSKGEPVGVCRVCGTITKHPITYSTYLSKKMDVDPTGDTFRRMLNTEKKREEKKRILYLHDFKIGG